MAAKDPLADLPPKDRRRLKRAIKLKALSDVYGSFEDQPFYADAVALAVQKIMVEDPDLANLEEHAATICDFVKRIQGHRDAFATCPWTRFPRDLVYYGHLAKMSAGEAKVYMALLALCDPRTLITSVSLERLAEFVNRHPDTVSKAITKLKKKGLVRRWCIRHPEARDESHYLWFTRIVPEACENTPEERAQLLKAAAMPKTA